MPKGVQVRLLSGAPKNKRRIEVKEYITNIQANPTVDNTLCYDTATNSIVVPEGWGSPVGQIVGGYHSGYSSPSQIQYSLMERHKTYQIINNFIKEYKKNKKQYKIQVNDMYSISNYSIITLPMNSTLNIDLLNLITNKHENLESIDKKAHPIIEHCIIEFLNEHAEELMESIHKAIKKDVVEFAKKEGVKIKEELELAEIIQNLED